MMGTIETVLCLDSGRGLLSRTYPPGFGRWLAKLHGRFLKEREAQWDFSKEALEESLLSFFGRIPWGDLWEDADMVSVLRYLRGSQSLHLGEWRPLFPKEL